VSDRKGGAFGEIPTPLFDRGCLWQAYFGQDDGAPRFSGPD